jgi:hypothetical protein
MTQARRRHMARLERLAAPLLEQISLAGEQLEDEIGARIYGDALIHAANFSLIVLFGDPQIDEPVSSAWERCCKSGSPLFDKFSNAKRLKDFGSPFDHGARRCAQYFRECAMPHLPGANDKEKFAPIFAGAPLWLLWFSWADATMAALDLPPRDRSDICKFLRSKDNFFGWPAFANHTSTTGNFSLFRFKSRAPPAWPTALSNLFLSARLVERIVASREEHDVVVGVQPTGDGARAVEQIQLHEFILHAEPHASEIALIHDLARSRP